MFQPKTIAALAAPAALLAALSGCGGGGATGGGAPAGGGPAGGGSAVQVPFAQFSGPNQSLTVGGVSATASGSRSTAGAITSRSRSGIDANASSATLSSGANAQLNAVNLTAPQSSAALQGFTCADSLCSRVTNPALTPSSDILLADPATRGWSYQTFGIWANRPSATAWNTGAMSMGHATPGTAVPTTGSATFVGDAFGFYADTAGTPFSTRAGMSANVNFSNRSITFSTSNTEVHRQGSTGGYSANSGLNLSGTLSYQPNSNHFTGSVATQNGQLSGNAGGRFYGPNAQEMGGVYTLGGSGPSHMLGGFGARR